MKVKILSILLVVFIAQAHVSQGSPLLSLGTNLVIGAGSIVDNTINSVVNAALTLFNQILASATKILGDLGAAASTNVNNLIDAANQLTTNAENNLNTDNGDVVTIIENGLDDAANIASELVQNFQSVVDSLAVDISQIVSNHTAVLSNLVKPITDTLNTFKNSLPGLDIFQSLVSLIPQTQDKVSAAVAVDESFTLTARDIIQSQIAANKQSLANLVTEIQDGANSLVTSASGISNNIGTLLTQTESMIAGITSQIAAGLQSASNTAFPLTTTTLKNAVSAAKTTASTIAAALSNKIKDLQNLAGGLAANFITAFESVAIGFENASPDVCDEIIANATTNVALNASTGAISCVTNEINRVNVCLAQIQNLAVQYQTSIATNSLNVGTLQTTLQTATKCQIDILSADIRLKACIAVNLVKSAINFEPAAGITLECIRSN